MSDSKAISEISVNVPVYKYLDIDSTYRNRNNYPNPNDFVIPYNYTNSGLNVFNSQDPISDAVPFTGSTVNQPGENETQTSADASDINLDPSEPTIDNYYIGDILQIGTEFRTITAYVSTGTDRIATVDSPFGSTPAPGTVYYTRYAQPIYVGSVASGPTTTTQFILSSASTIASIYVGSYVRFTSGVNNGLIAIISAYSGAGSLVTLSSALPNAPSPGDTLEIDAFTRDNATSLLYAGSVPKKSGQVCYYEIELLWLSVPNQTLNVGYGGTMDTYPYVYVSLYNESSRLANQVLFSNNPNSATVMFKVPVDEYFGDTYFMTLTNAKTKQIVRFETDADIRFTVSLPSGDTVSYDISDSMSPNAPDPLIQVNALFSLRKIT